MRISEYFTDKSLLVTGASGLVGKAFVEKTLRSCPDVNKIYLIVRQKRGCGPEERWKKIVDGERSIFETIRKTHPERLSKVVVMSGANELDNFGLSPENMKVLEENVNMIFHSAATINFLEPMKSAILVNMKATYTLCEMARRMKNFESFIHISTAFSQAYRCTVNEKVYEAAYDWRGLISLADDPQNESILSILTPIIVGEQTISYTFTKALAENIVDEYSQYFPVAIMRISLVTGCMFEPEVAWIDVMNFMAAICVGVRAGVIRCSLNKMTDRLPQIPLDYSVKSLLIAAWSLQESKTKSGTKVFCCRQADHLDLDFNDVRYKGLNYASRWPWETSLWYPYILQTESLFLYKLYFRVLHVIPALFLDTLAEWGGKKPRLFKVYANMWKLTDLFERGLDRKLDFRRENYLSLQTSICTDDKKDFFLDEDRYMAKQPYFDACSRITLFFFGGERLGDAPPPSAVRRLKIQRVLHVLTFLAFGLFGGWLSTVLFGTADPIIKMLWYAVFVALSGAAVWSTMVV